MWEWGEFKGGRGQKSYGHWNTRKGMNKKKSTCPKERRGETGKETDRKKSSREKGKTGKKAYARTPQTSKCSLPDRS